MSPLPTCSFRLLHLRTLAGPLQVCFQLQPTMMSFFFLLPFFLCLFYNSQGMRMDHSTTIFLQPLQCPLLPNFVANQPLVASSTLALELNSFHSTQRLIGQLTKKRERKWVRHDARLRTTRVGREGDSSHKAEVALHLRQKSYTLCTFRYSIELTDG